MPSDKISEHFADSNRIDNVDKVERWPYTNVKDTYILKNILYPYFENHWKNPEMFLFFPQ